VASVEVATPFSPLGEGTVERHRTKVCNGEPEFGLLFSLLLNVVKALRRGEETRRDALRSVSTASMFLFISAD
jgi:hypothetical protein